MEFDKVTCYSTSIPVTINTTLNMSNISKHELNIMISFYMHLIELSGQLNIKRGKINITLFVCADVKFSHCYASALLAQNSNFYCIFQIKILCLYSVNDYRLTSQGLILCRSDENFLHVYSTLIFCAVNTK
jgi:hypothetical protein